MTPRARLGWAAAALGAAALAAVVAELAFVDRDGFDSPLWGGDVAGVWAALGVLSAVALTVAAAVVGRLLLQRWSDPYG